MRNRYISVLQETSIPTAIYAKEKQITFLQIEIAQASIEKQLTVQSIQQKFKTLRNYLKIMLELIFPMFFEIESNIW